MMSSLNDITYLGAFDDRIQSNLASVHLSIKTLNEILVSELLFSIHSQIVINDGYIVNSPILKEALNQTKGSNKKEQYYYEKSPLYSLIKNKYVSILSRDTSLTNMVENMASQDNRAFLELKMNKNWETNLAILDRDLSGCFVKWPGHDISAGFHKIFSELLAIPPSELNIQISEDEFKRLADTYNSEIAKNGQSPRNKWEIIVSNSPYKNELMWIANVAYHYNFGLCLQSDIYKSKNVYINTLNNTLFPAKIVAPIETEADLSKLNFSIPGVITIDDKFVTALKIRGELNEIHKAFVETNRKYISGEASEKALKKIQGDLRKKIIDFDKTNSPTKSSSFFKKSISLTCAGLGAAIGCTITGPVAAFYTTVTAGIAGNAIINTIDLSRTLIKYKSDKCNLAPRNIRTGFSSYKISPEEAEKHTADLKTI